MDTKTFAELGLSPKVQAAITAAGYSTPTPIQAAAIPVAVTGRDILGIAQTGTGKTASFVLPMITRLETGRARARMPRSLILAPTRELAAQVAQSFEKYGVNHKLNVALLIGGVSMDEQVKKLDRGVDVLIATPGRMLDHFQRGRLMLMGVEILVIDEADRMLDMGFIPDIEKICKLLPPRRQTLFFSATMPTEITRLVDQFLRDPERIEVARPATTAQTITQRFRYCPDGEDWVKREMLREMIRSEDVKNAIVFCNRKRDVAILLKSLLKHGFNAGALHGDMDQNSRTDTLDKFRSGEISLLAASDVAARGLDIPEVSHVFNYDLPWQADDYVHRIGRTGRAGREGTAHSIVTPDDLKSFKDIEKMLGVAAEWIGDAPTEDELADAGSAAADAVVPVADVVRRLATADAAMGARSVAVVTAPQLLRQKAHARKTGRMRLVPSAASRSRRKRLRLRRLAASVRRRRPGPPRDSERSERRPSRRHEPRGDQPRGDRAHGDRAQADAPNGNGHRSNSEQPREEPRTQAAPQREPERAPERAATKRRAESATSAPGREVSPTTCRLSSGDPRGP